MNNSGVLKKIGSLPYFPVILAIYSVLFLFSNNLGQIPISVIVRPLIISVVFAIVIYALCLLMIRKIHKAGLVSGWLLFLFFIYGHGYDLIKGKVILGMEMGYLKPAVFFLLLAVIGILFILKFRLDLASFSLLLNIALSGFVLFSLFRIVQYQIVATQKIDSVKKVSADIVTPRYPDIYYFVLDSYSSNDVLAAKYKYDNASFTNELISMGFYIPKCAYSNYFRTATSISSSLNMQYLDEFNIPIEENVRTENLSQLQKLIHQSRVREELKELGYEMYAFRGFAPATDVNDADHYYEVFDDDSQSTTTASLGFENLYLKTTLLRLPEEYFQQNKNNFLWNKLPDSWKIVFDPEVLQFSSRSYQWYRQHIYTFDKLEEVPDLPGQKFVYAHIYATHQPYVFRADGSFLWPINEDNFNYIPAIEYTNARMLEIIETILQKSEIPPIIIVQADHGMPSGITRNKILHAIYLPGHEEALYNTMTPVNTFRVIFNATFGTDYDLLEDKIYVLDENTGKVRSQCIFCTE